MALSASLRVILAAGRASNTRINNLVEYRGKTMLSRSPKRNRRTGNYVAAWAIALMLCTWASAQRLAGLSPIVRLEKPAQGSPRSLPAIHSRAEFDSLAVVYDPNTPYALPHVLFVIDRQNGNRIYYVNTKRYAFHKDFVNGTYLSLERGQVFFENNYLKTNRRFIMGTIAYQTPVRKWTFEFWEDDLIPTDPIKLASDVTNETFFTPCAFKPHSTRKG